MSVGMAIGIGIGISLGSMGVGATLGAIYGKDSVVGAFGLGILQGWANIFNGIQDITVGLLNLFIFSQNMQWKYMCGGLMPFQIPTVLSPDWSNGLFTEEDKNFLGLGEYWGDSHGWSKFIGGESFVALVSMGTASMFSNQVSVLSQTGVRGAVMASARPLTIRQSQLLSKLPAQNTSVIVPKKGVNMRDLKNMTMHTGDEFAILTRGNQRMIFRGTLHEVPMLTEMTAKQYAQNGWRLSGHVHPNNLRVASSGDVKVMKAFGQDNIGIWGVTWGYGGKPYGKAAATIVFH
ncbi:MAG: hypothetical protein LBE12_08740 [Planctomycetaceae bacterium]|jgi:hypothetical protein|nr:hypothetical protein [Planctomycetaceae bacterium]